MTNNENQTLGDVMKYLNLTPIGLKRALIVKNGRNWRRTFCSGANRLLMMMMSNMAVVSLACFIVVLF